MKMSTTLKYSWRYACGWVLGLCILCAVADNTQAIPLNYMNDDPKDVDKLHELGNWFRNYWDDLDDDGEWDPDEPIGDAIDPAWTNPKEGGDGTCWITVAANLLAQSGYENGDAEAIYWDILLNMDIPAFPDYEGDPDSVYGENWWVPGGWQQDALNWYLENRSDPFLDSSVTVYYADYPPDMLEYPWVENPFEVAAEALASGKQVGIVLYGDDIWHDITFQGYDAVTQTVWVTDSERDLNGQDLNQYSYALDGPTGWSLFYDGHGKVTVDMLVILDSKVVPEPATGVLLGLGLLLGLWRVRRNAKR